MRLRDIVNNETSKSNNIALPYLSIKYNKQSLYDRVTYELAHINDSISISIDEDRISLNINSDSISNLLNEILTQYDDTRIIVEDIDAVSIGRDARVVRIKLRGLYGVTNIVVIYDQEHSSTSLYRLRGIADDYMNATDTLDGLESASDTDISILIQSLYRVPSKFLSPESQLVLGLENE